MALQARLDSKCVVSINVGCSVGTVGFTLSLRSHIQIQDSHDQAKKVEIKAFGNHVALAQVFSFDSMERNPHFPVHCHTV